MFDLTLSARCIRRSMFDVLFRPYALNFPVSARFNPSTPKAFGAVHGERFNESPM
jgi:hypothetical protein